MARCPETQNGVQCVEEAGHTVPHHGPAPGACANCGAAAAPGAAFCGACGQALVASPGTRSDALPPESLTVPNDAGGAPPVRPWWKKRWGIAAIVVGVIVVLGALGSAAKPPADRFEPSQSPAAAAARASASPIATASATRESTAEPAPTREPPTEPTPTTEPTPAPEPSVEPTAEPSPVPTPVRPVLAKTGKGDKILKFAAQDGPVVALIKNTGSGNFAVISYSGTEYDDLLVNTIGSYSGRVYVAPGVNLLKVTSSGSWSVDLRPIASAPRWNGTSALKGTGDYVVLVSDGAFGTTTIANSGKGNFAVIAYDEYGEYLDLLVNEIGSYHGEVLLPESDPIVLAIHADGGKWSMSAID
jgi:hypothetical protein